MTTRRRFLAITAGLALGPASMVAAPRTSRWQGIALGARATIVVKHPEAERLIDRARAEIARLEAVFSLHRSDSALACLNRAGGLDAPPLELVELLTLGAALHAATNGAFDPSVQPLWALHAESAAAASLPGAAALAAARRSVGFDEVRIGADRIAFARPGMALTLNGIAQGYIADRVAALLAAEGLPGALIDTGEIHALGNRPDGSSWPVGLADRTGAVATQLHLRDRAVATSAPLGTVLDARGRLGHIIDPRSGQPGGRWRSVSVTAPRAALADGLSTAFCLLPHAMITRALRHFPRAEVVWLT